MRLTTRLTLLFAAASSVVLLVLGFVIASAVEKHFEEQDLALLNGKLEFAAHALGRLRTEADLSNLPQQLDDSLVGYHGLAVAVLEAQGQVIFATSGARFPQALISASREKPQATPFVWTQEGIPYRGISAALPSGLPGQPPMLVAVATDISHHQAFMLSFRTTLWFFVAGAALLTGLLGWLAASRGLAPLRAMRDKAAAVTAEQLSQRLPVDAVPLELAELAAGLNEMLARLEEAFRRLSDFSTDLAHELRTPISNLMTQTQVTLSRARDAAEYRDILESNAEEYERLAKMITDMLFLARAENGLEIPHREEIDLAVEVQALFDFYDALAEEKNIAMTRQGEAQTRGDRLMLRRALGNLLANAIRHTPPHGTIRVRISSDENAISIAVGNNGEAIPSQHLERLFDRFYRADPSRQRQTEGAGLGLAIVKSIMVAHGGSISVASANDWTEFTLMLPAKPVVL